MFPPGLPPFLASFGAAHLRSRRKRWGDRRQAKNYLFYTKVLHDFDLINNLICKTKKGLDLNKTLPKKVLVYSVSGEMLQFDSKEEAARFLNVQARTITSAYSDI